jgi:predicted amidophosphoribosyltransferase
VSEQTKCPRCGNTDIRADGQMIVCTRCFFQLRDTYGRTPEDRAAEKAYWQTSVVLERAAQGREDARLRDETARRLLGWWLEGAP